MSADQNLPLAPTRARKMWKTTLFLAGSGLLGGVAFALWNRRELTELASKGSVPVADERSIEVEEAIY